MPPTRCSRRPGGNPFFVTEVLACRRATGPGHGRRRRHGAGPADFPLRPGRRSSSSRSSRPGWTRRWSSRSSATSGSSRRRSARHCSRSAPHGVAFRHELARRAVCAAYRAPGGRPAPRRARRTAVAGPARPVPGGPPRGGRGRRRHSWSATGRPAARGGRSCGVAPAGARPSTNKWPRTSRRFRRGTRPGRPRRLVGALRQPNAGTTRWPRARQAVQTLDGGR